MRKVILTNGTTYTITETLAESMQDSIEKQHDNIIYWDKLNGWFRIRMKEIKQIV